MLTTHNRLLYHFTESKSGLNSVDNLSFFAAVVLLVSLLGCFLPIFPIVTMPEKKATAAPTPAVQWSDNMIWQLIDQIE
jgi:hypothetical protein